MNALEYIEDRIKYLPDSGGVEGRSNRVSLIAHETLSVKRGNFIEIGAGIGETTRRLLVSAKAFSHSVLVIDPFESGWNDMPESYGKPYPYEQFKKNVGDSPNLIVHKYSSQHPSCYDFIFQHAPISFAFIDGLQYKDAVLSDLRLVAQFNPAVICVDDINRLSDISQVPLALEEFLPSSNYKLVKTDREVMEGYLVRK